MYRCTWNEALRIFIIPILILYWFAVIQSRGIYLNNSPIKPAWAHEEPSHLAYAYLWFKNHFGSRAKIPTHQNVAKHQNQLNNSFSLSFICIHSCLIYIYLVLFFIRKIGIEILIEKIFTCIPHSIDIVREVDSPNDIFEIQ